MESVAFAEERSLIHLLRPYESSYLAETLDVSQSTASGYKAGRIFPPAKRFEALASLLNIDVAEIVRLATRFHNDRDGAGA